MFLVGVYKTGTPKVNHVANYAPLNGVNGRTRDYYVLGGNATFKHAMDGERGKNFAR